MSLKDKTVVITGATAGIGWQSALDFARAGAFVIGIGRNPLRCVDAEERIKSQVPKAKIQYLVADLSSQKQIRECAKEVASLLKKNHSEALDVLVNNAGVYMGQKTFTEDGIEMTFAVNHLAPFLLTHLLLPLLEKSSGGRVITVSSDSHYNTLLFPERAKNPIFFFGLLAYKASKLCNVLFSFEFNRLNNGRATQAFAVDPGLVNTDIGLKDTGGLAKLVWRSRQKLGVPPEEPAQTILYLAEDSGVDTSMSIYWYKCQAKVPARNATNAKLARRLWMESCRLTGVAHPEGEENVL